VVLTRAEVSAKALPSQTLPIPIVLRFRLMDSPSRPRLDRCTAVLDDEVATKEHALVSGDATKH
jgi:hypothetical protein